jgi:hypothetical protein
MMSDEESSQDTRGGFRISEDWAATAVGLLLLVLIVSGVITKGVLQ